MTAVRSRHRRCRGRGSGAPRGLNLREKDLAGAGLDLGGRGLAAHMRIDEAAIARESS